MSLNGSAFLDPVLVCTIATFVVLVLLWPALAGPSIAKIALRAGMLLTVNVLVLLTAATQLSAQYQWSADWTDLQGAFGGPTAETALSRGATAALATSRKVTGTAAKAGRRLPPPATSRTG